MKYVKQPEGMKYIGAKKRESNHMIDWDGVKLSAKQPD